MEVQDHKKITSSGPMVEKTGTKEHGSSAGMGLKSSRSDDELFSDAVTEFSDSGFSPVLDKNVGRELLNDLEDTHVFKLEKTADTSQPLHDLNQTSQGPINASEMSHSDVIGGKRNQSEITESVSDISTENVSVGLGSTNGLESDSSQFVSEFASLSDHSEIGKQNELMISSIEEKGKSIEAVDVQSPSEVLHSENKLQIEPKLGEIEDKISKPIALEALAHETDKETADRHIEHEFESKITNVNGDKSHTRIVDEIVDQEKEPSNNLQFKHDDSSQTESPNFERASVISEVESDSVETLIGSSHGQSDEVFNLEKLGKEETHLLSVTETLPAVENLEALIRGFKDYKVLKSSFPVDLEAAEEIRSLEDDRKVSVPAGSIDNASSDTLEDDLNTEGVSAPTGGEIGASVPVNLPSALSSVPVCSIDNTSSEAFQDEPKKEGVSTAIAGEAGTSVPDNLPRSVAVGTVNISSSEASKDDLKRECSSTLIDGVATSALEILPSARSSVPAGTVDNLPSEVLEDDLAKKSISSPIDGEVGTSVPENPSSAVSTVPAVTIDNTSSEASKDELKKEGVSTLTDGAVGSSVPENPPSALTSVLAGIADNASQEALEDDLTKEAVSTPIHGDVPSSGYEDTHLLPAADTLPAVENSEAMIGDFKDYKGLKSSFPVDLGAAEDFRYVEDDKKVTVPENLPSALTNVPAGNVDNSSSDTMEDDFKKDGVLIPIDGEVGSSGFSFTVEEDFGSSGAVDHPKPSGLETNNSQSDSNLDGSLPLSLDGNPVQNEDSEPTTREQSDSTPLESSRVEQAGETTNLSGGENADNHGIDKTSKVAAEQKSEKHAESVHESTHLLTDSASLNVARGSDQLDIDIRDLGKIRNSSESPNCSDKIPSTSEGLEISHKPEVPRTPDSPAMVSELKYEETSLPSEKISENSGSKEISDFPVESELPDESSVGIKDINVRDATVPAPFFNDDKYKVATQDFSGPAVDNSTVSSRRTDSLDANWGSVSVLSTQSDVTAAADAEVLSLTNTQAAERMDGVSKKPQAAAAECRPDKSDVFEPPSFMTLVESGPGVDQNAAVSEIQTAQRDEQTNSEALQAGWFPSLNNIVNESEGRKKSEEIIAKVTNWSTGKQHSPLKNLQSEAHAETKAKSPNTKKDPAVSEADETAPKNNGTAVTTVSSVLGSEMQSADTVKKEMEKEWNSPASYPIQIKKEKRKGKSHWVPFVCCSSVHQDV